MELPETPAEYERYALKRDLELQSRYERWSSARSEARAAGSRWPQPNVAYRTFLDAMWHDDARMMHRGMVSQRIPWPGVLDRAAEPAQLRAEALEHRFRSRALEVVFEVRKLLIETARIDETREILRGQRDIYRDVGELVDQNMESDLADYGDSLRVSTAREKIRDRLDALASERTQKVTELRNRLDLSADTDLTVRFEGGDDPLDVPQDAPDRENLIEAARNEHPDVAAVRAEADAERARAAYARAKRLPWPKLALGVQSSPIRMPGNEFDRRTALMIDVSVPLPLFLGQYRREGEQFERQRDAALVDSERVRRDVGTRVDRAVTRIEEKLRRLRRYRDELLPLADDATEHMLQKIETGERTVTDYLLSFEQELDLQTNVVEFRAAIAKERARLEKMTGGSFEADPERESPTIEIRDLSDEERDDE
jgi:outer membrane protein TolC